MSFILDALKKSESERHRQSGPVLMDVRIAAPRRRIPPWAWVIAAVLVVNLAVLTWVLWLSPAHRGEAVAPAAVATTAPPAAAAVAPSAASAAVTPDAAPATPPAADPAAAAPVPAPVPAPPATAAQFPAQVPAPQPSQVAPFAPAPATQNIDVSTLPKVADMVASGIALPELQLSWHVYDAAPQSRYVLLNGARLREGDATADGVRVVAIAPTGVVVEWRGRRMFLGAGR
jgi:general secretion pathway protein B